MRPHRRDPQGGYHHITNHRSGSGDLFLSDADRYLFLRLLADATKRFKADVVSYCLMLNHYHLLLYCPEAGLSHVLHHVASNYARAFNLRHDRSGPLFQSRFANKLITSDEQLQLTDRYIHRNPIELGFDIRTYPWSSYPIYCGNRLPPSDVVPIAMTVPLALAGGSNSYPALIEQDRPSDKFLCSRGQRLQIATEAPNLGEALADLCDIVVSLTGCQPSDITSGRPGRSNPGRLMAALVAYDSGIGFTNETSLALNFSSATSYTSAVYRARTRAQTDNEFRDIVAAATIRWSWATKLQAA